MSKTVEQYLGKEAESLLSYTCKNVSKEDLYLPGSDYIERVFSDTDRSPAVMRSFQQLLDHGRLGGSGYLSILPVDQGIEHSAGASFAANPRYFDPKNIVELAIEGGCNAVASTGGVLASVARKYAHKIPFMVKLNHNETLTNPGLHDQNMFATVEQSFDMGAIAVGATVYFGAENSRHQIMEVADAFARAHELGMVTVLWAYTRNQTFKLDGKDYHTADDLTGQANHLAVTIGADIVKQKQATISGGFRDLHFGYTDDRVYSELSGSHPIDMTRYQLVNCYMGRFGLINSGGAAGSDDDLAESVRTAVINKRAGGMGLILGRKCFKKPLKEGIELLHAVQDVYLDEKVTIA